MPVTCDTRYTTRVPDITAVIIVLHSRKAMITGDYWGSRHRSPERALNEHDHHVASQITTEMAKCSPRFYCTEFAVVRKMETKKLHKLHTK